MTNFVTRPIQLFLLLFACGASSEVRDAGDVEVQVTKVFSSLDVPWAIAFLPECEFLVTQREGELLHFNSDGDRQEVAGVPKVYAGGQGGLLDVVAARDFAATREIFITYAKPQRNGGAGTAVSVARLSKGGDRLENVQELFEMAAGSRGGRHFGSRVVEAADGSLFITLGERGDRFSAQDLSLHNGKVVRILRDGSVFRENPFLDVAGARPEIWSLGHRNPQGAALDASGNLWVVEHGARGGDEINAVERGRNYGWPVIAYGRHYSGGKIGEGFAKEGLEQPEFYWDPSIAPSGLAIYSGKLWPDWEGHMFVGALKFDYIARLDPEGGLREMAQLKFPETRRVRDVREAPDGSIWFLSEDRHAAYRITPVGFPPPGGRECGPRER